MIESIITDMVSGKSGSAYIDCKLHEWLADTFGTDFTNLAPSKTGPGSAVMRDFESIKKSFDGEDMDEVFGLAFPSLGKALRDRNVASTCFDAEDGEVRISAYVLASPLRSIANDTTEKPWKVCSSLFLMQRMVL